MKFADLEEVKGLDDLLTQIGRLADAEEPWNVSITIEGTGSNKWSEEICDDDFVAAFVRFLGQQRKAVTARMAKLGVTGAA